VTDLEDMYFCYVKTIIKSNYCYKFFTLYIDNNYLLALTLAFMLYKHVSELNAMFRNSSASSG